MRILLILATLISSQTCFAGSTDWPFKDPKKIESFLAKRFPPCLGSAGGNSGSLFVVNTRIFEWDLESYNKTAEGELAFFVEAFEKLGYKVTERGSGSGGASDSLEARKLKFKLKSDNEEITLFIISQHSVTKADEVGYVTVYWCCDVNS